MAKQKTSFRRIVGYVLLLLVAVGVVGFIARFTNGFTNDFQTFYVVYNDETIIGTHSGLVLPLEKEHRFDCKYTFGAFAKNQTAEYSVAVIPNPKKDFDFIVDGETVSLTDNQDYSAAFDIDIHDDYFTFFIPKENTMENILSRAYDGITISIPSEIDFMEDDYFLLCVYSKSGKALTQIGFRIGLIIVFDKENICL